MEALLDLMAFALPIFFLRGLTEWDLALMAGRMLNGDRLEAGHRLKLEDGGTAVWTGEAWTHDSTGEPMKLLASGNKYWRGDSMEYRRPSDEYSELSDPDPDEPSDAFATENERSLMRIYESLREAIYWEDPRLGTLMNFSKFAEFMFAMTVPFTRVVLWDRNRNW
eukprot:tig00021017_g17226.t1